LLHSCSLRKCGGLPAGVPADNDYTFCTSNISAACYFYKSSALNYVSARAACKAQGGDLVSYNTEDEQQAVSVRLVPRSVPLVWLANHSLADPPANTHTLTCQPSLR
jgi:hypothetical protein